MNVNRVTLKLTVAFAILIGVLIAIGWLGLSRMALMSGDIHEIVDRRWQKVQLSREALGYSTLNSRITMQIFLLDDRPAIDLLLEQRARNTESISGLLTRIEAQLESEKETELLSAIRTVRAPYVESYKRALGLLLKEGQPEAGRRMMADIVTANLIAYHHAWEAFVQHEGMRMDHAGDRAEAHYISTRRNVAILLAIALLLACVVAAYVTRGVNREIFNRMKADRKLGEAHAALERRVVERTAELSQTNTELAATHRILQASTHRLRMMLDASPECVKLVAVEGTVLEMNPAGLRLIEADEPHQVIGKNVFDLVVPEDHEVFRELNAAVFRGESRSAEFSVIGLKGARLRMETHACPLRDADGTIFAQLAITRDVSERVRTALAMRESEQRYRSLIESLPAAVYTCDREGRVNLFNAAAADLWGREPELGKNLWCGSWKIFSPAGAPIPLDDCPMAIAIREGRSVRGREIIIERPDGTRRFVQPHPDPIFDANGRVIGAVNMLVDLTARKAAEDELEQLHQKLLAASRQAGMAEVATGVLHNVGNVLNSVNVTASLVTDKVRRSKGPTLSRVCGLLREHASDLGTFLSTDPKGKQVPAFLDALAGHLTAEQKSIQEELAQLTANIEHIKDIVNMQQSYATVVGITENLNPVDLIEDALRMNAGSFLKHELELVREFAPDLPRVSVDKHKVLQILINLLRNAKYACDDSGRTDKRVTVRAVRENGSVRITVADNGVGIPQENLTRIFNHGFTTRDTGHGFGLHSGANAAKEMSGSLTPYSDGPGLGAAFTLELPAEVPAKQEAA